MLTPRICVIGLPRSGSQYAVELIKLNGYYPYYDLVEPFEPDKPIIELQNNQIILTTQRTCDEQHRIRDALSKLSKGDINQSLITRVFPVKEQKTHFFTIINTLINLNFDFIVLKRNNIEHHLLSFAVALATDVWTKFDNKKNELITITHFSQITWLYNEISSYNALVENLDINYDLINYELIVNDLSRVMGSLINTNVKIYKQSDIDPYERISNANEVRDFIKTLLHD
jgi:hypothetical protein